MQNRTISLALITTLFFCAGINALKAEIITFYPVQVLGGGTAPVGQDPWITASFDDHGQAGSVTLTLTGVNLAIDQYVNKWLFNLDPSLKAYNLKFTSLVKTGAFSTPSIYTGANSFAVSSEKYDIYLQFSSAAGHSNRFDALDSLSMEISGISSLTARSFNVNPQGSTPYGNLPTTTEAYIGGIGYCRHDGTWIATPEPSSAVLALCGLLGITLLCRRKRA